MSAMDKESSNAAPGSKRKGSKDKSSSSSSSSDDVFSEVVQLHPTPKKRTGGKVVVHSSPKTGGRSAHSGARHERRAKSRTNPTAEKVLDGGESAFFSSSSSSSSAPSASAESSGQRARQDNDGDGAAAPDAMPDEHGPQPEQQQQQQSSSAEPGDAERTAAAAANGDSNELSTGASPSGGSRSGREGSESITDAHGRTDSPLRRRASSAEREARDDDDDAAENHASGDEQSSHSTSHGRTRHPHAHGGAAETEAADDDGERPSVAPHAHRHHSSHHSGEHHGHHVMKKTSTERLSSKHQSVDDMSSRRAHGGASSTMHSRTRTDSIHGSLGAGANAGSSPVGGGKSAIAAKDLDEDEYLERFRLLDLIGDLALALLRVKPDDHSGFAHDWLMQERHNSNYTRAHRAAGSPIGSVAADKSARQHHGSVTHDGGGSSSATMHGQHSTSLVPLPSASAAPTAGDTPAAAQAVEAGTENSPTAIAVAEEESTVIHDGHAILHVNPRKPAPPSTNEPIPVLTPSEALHRISADHVIESTTPAPAPFGGPRQKGRAPGPTPTQHATKHAEPVAGPPGVERAGADTAAPPPMPSMVDVPSSSLAAARDAGDQPMMDNTGASSSTPVTTPTQQTVIDLADLSVTGMIGGVTQRRLRRKSTKDAAGSKEPFINLPPGATTAATESVAGPSARSFGSLPERSPNAHSVEDTRSAGVMGREELAGQGRRADPAAPTSSTDVGSRTPAIVSPSAMSLAYGSRSDSAGDYHSPLITPQTAFNDAEMHRYLEGVIQAAHSTPSDTPPAAGAASIRAAASDDHSPTPVEAASAPPAAARADETQYGVAAAAAAAAANAAIVAATDAAAAATVVTAVTDAPRVEMDGSVAIAEASAAGEVAAVAGALAVAGGDATHVPSASSVVAPAAAAVKKPSASSSSSSSETGDDGLGLAVFSPVISVDRVTDFRLAPGGGAGGAAERAGKAAGTGVGSTGGARKGTNSSIPATLLAAIAPHTAANARVHRGAVPSTATSTTTGDLPTGTPSAADTAANGYAASATGASAAASAMQDGSQVGSRNGSFGYGHGYQPSRARINLHSLAGGNQASSPATVIPMPVRGSATATSASSLLSNATKLASSRGAGVGVGGGSTGAYSMGCTPPSNLYGSPSVAQRFLAEGLNGPMGEAYSLGSSPQQPQPLASLPGEAAAGGALDGGAGSSGREAVSGPLFMGNHHAYPEADPGLAAVGGAHTHAQALSAAHRAEGSGELPFLAFPPLSTAGATATAAMSPAQATHVSVANSSNSSSNLAFRKAEQTTAGLDDSSNAMAISGKAFGFKKKPTAGGVAGAVAMHASPSTQTLAALRDDAYKRMQGLLTQLPPAKYAAVVVFLEGLAAPSAEGDDDDSTQSGCTPGGGGGIRSVSAGEDVGCSFASDARTTPAPCDFTQSRNYGSNLSAAGALGTAGTDGTGEGVENGSYAGAPLHKTSASDDYAKMHCPTAIAAAAAAATAASSGGGTSVGSPNGMTLSGAAPTSASSTSLTAQAASKTALSPEVEAVVKDALSQSIILRLPADHMRAKQNTGTGTGKTSSNAAGGTSAAANNNSSGLSAADAASPSSTAPVTAGSLRGGETTLPEDGTGGTAAGAAGVARVGPRTATSPKGSMGLSSSSEVSYYRRPATPNVASSSSRGGKKRFPRSESKESFFSQGAMEASQHAREQRELHASRRDDDGGVASARPSAPQSPKPSFTASVVGGTRFDDVDDNPLGSKQATSVVNNLLDDFTPMGDAEGGGEALADARRDTSSQFNASNTRSDGASASSPTALSTTTYIKPSTGKANEGKEPLPEELTSSVMADEVSASQLLPAPVSESNAQLSVNREDDRTDSGSSPGLAHSSTASSPPMKDPLMATAVPSMATTTGELSLTVGGEHNVGGSGSVSDSPDVAISSECTPAPSETGAASGHLLVAGRDKAHHHDHGDATVQRHGLHTPAVAAKEGAAAQTEKAPTVSSGAPTPNKSHAGAGPAEHRHAGPQPFGSALGSLASDYSAASSDPAAMLRKSSSQRQTQVPSAAASLDAVSTNSTEDSAKRRGDRKPRPASLFGENDAGAGPRITQWADACSAAAPLSSLHPSTAETKQQQQQQQHPTAEAVEETAGTQRVLPSAETDTDGHPSRTQAPTAGAGTPAPESENASANHSQHSAVENTVATTQEAQDGPLPGATIKSGGAAATKDPASPAISVQSNFSSLYRNDDPASNDTFRMQQKHFRETVDQRQQGVPGSTTTSDAGRDLRNALEMTATAAALGESTTTPLDIITPKQGSSRVVSKNGSQTFSERAVTNIVDDGTSKSVPSPAPNPPEAAAAGTTDDALLDLLPVADAAGPVSTTPVINVTSPGLTVEHVTEAGRAAATPVPADSFGVAPLSIQLHDGSKTGACTVVSASTVSYEVPASSAAAEPFCASTAGTSAAREALSSGEASSSSELGEPESMGVQCVDEQQSAGVRKRQRRHRHRASDLTGAFATESPISEAMNAFLTHESRLPAGELEAVRRAVSRSQLFSSVEDTQMETLVHAMTRQLLQKDDVLIHEGDPSQRALLLVADGALSVSSKGILKRAITSGQTFGEMELSYDVEKSHVTITATTDTAVVYKLAKEDFTKVVLYEAEARRLMFTQYIDRIPFLAPLTSLEKSRLAEGLRVCRLQDGEALVEQAEPAEYMFLIISGEVELTFSKAKLREQQQAAKAAAAASSASCVSLSSLGRQVPRTAAASHALLPDSWSSYTFGDETPADDGAGDVQPSPGIPARTAPDYLSDGGKPQQSPAQTAQPARSSSHNSANSSCTGKASTAAATAVPNAVRSTASPGEMMSPLAGPLVSPLSVALPPDLPADSAAMPAVAEAPAQVPTSAAGPENPTPPPEEATNAAPQAARQSPEDVGAAQLMRASIASSTSHECSSAVSAPTSASAVTQVIGLHRAGQLVGEAEFAFMSTGIMTVKAHRGPVQAARISLLNLSVIISRQTLDELKYFLVSNPAYRYFERCAPETAKREMRSIALSRTVSQKKNVASETAYRRHQRFSSGTMPAISAVATGHTQSASTGANEGKETAAASPPNTHLAAGDSAGVPGAAASVHSPRDSHLATPREKRRSGRGGSAKSNANLTVPTPAAEGMGGSFADESVDRKSHKRHRGSKRSSSNQYNSTAGSALFLRPFHGSAAGGSSSTYQECRSPNGSNQRQADADVLQRSHSTRAGTSSRRNTADGEGNRSSGGAGPRDGHGSSVGRASRYAHVSADGEIIFSGSRNLYRFSAQALRASNSILIAVVVDGTVIRWNAVAQKVIGYAPYEVVGQNILDLLDTDESRQHMKDTLRLTREFAGNWDDYTSGGYDRQHVFAFRENTGFSQIGVALSVIPSLFTASAEVFLLIGREAKYRAAASFAADVARWLNGGLKPQLQNFGRSLAKIEANQWQVTFDDAIRMRGHLDACISMVNQFARFSSMNMENVTDSWRPVRLPTLIRRFMQDANSMLRKSNYTFFCNVDDITPRTEVFLDAKQVLEVLRLLLEDAVHANAFDPEVAVNIELRVTVVEPEDTQEQHMHASPSMARLASPKPMTTATATNVLGSLGGPVASSSAQGVLTTHVVSDPVRASTQESGGITNGSGASSHPLAAYAADPTVTSQTGSSFPVWSPTGEAPPSDVSSGVTPTSAVSQRQTVDLSPTSLRRIRFEMRDNGPSIPSLRPPEGQGESSSVSERGDGSLQKATQDAHPVTDSSSPAKDESHAVTSLSAATSPMVPFNSPVSPSSSPTAFPSPRAEKPPVQPASPRAGSTPASGDGAAATGAGSPGLPGGADRSHRGAELPQVEKTVTAMGGILYGYTRPEVEGNMVRVELPMLAVPGSKDTDDADATEEVTAADPSKGPLPATGKSLTVIVADNDRSQQAAMCQILWARQHAVVPVTSFKELMRKIEANAADILIIDPLQLDISAEDYQSLTSDNPFDDIRDASARMVLVVMGTDFSDWRVLKLLDRNSVIELPKLGSAVLVHIAMQEAEQIVAEMRSEEERIELLRRTFTCSVAERHKVGRLLGKGTFGDVYEVEDTLTGGKMAMKRMQLHDGVFADEVVEEILAMTRLQHENIIHYFYCEKESDALLRLYMELAPGGTLRSKIRQHPGVGLPFEQIVQHLTDICRGLAYVHSQHYVHGDLKTANLLIGARGRTKIGDFGTAKQVRPGQKLYAMVGTPQYMAPEVLNADAEQKQGYDFKADIWSVGCIALEMATGQPPFAHLEQTHGMGILKYLSDLTDTPDLSSLFNVNALVYEFVKGCLDVDPDSRPTAQELCHFEMLEGAVTSTRAERIVKRAEMLYKLNKYAAMRPDPDDPRGFGDGDGGESGGSSEEDGALEDDFSFQLSEDSDALRYNHRQRAADDDQSGSTTYSSSSTTSTVDDRDNGRAPRAQSHRHHRHHHARASSTSGSVSSTSSSSSGSSSGSSSSSSGSAGQSTKPKPSKQPSTATGDGAGSPAGPVTKGPSQTTGTTDDDPVKPSKASSTTTAAAAAISSASVRAHKTGTPSSPGPRKKAGAARRAPSAKVSPFTRGRTHAESDFFTSSSSSSSARARSPWEHSAVSAGQISTAAGSPVAREPSTGGAAPVPSPAAPGAAEAPALSAQPSPAPAADAAAAGAVPKP